MSLRKKLQELQEDYAEDYMTLFERFGKLKDEVEALKREIDTLKHARQVEEDRQSYSEQIAEWFDGPKEGEA